MNSSVRMEFVLENGGKHMHGVGDVEDRTAESLWAIASTDTSGENRSHSTSGLDVVDEQCVNDDGGPRVLCDSVFFDSVAVTEPVGNSLNSNPPEQVSEKKSYMSLSNNNLPTESSDMSAANVVEDIVTVFPHNFSRSNSVEKHIVITLGEDCEDRKSPVTKPNPVECDVDINERACSVEENENELKNALKITLGSLIARAIDGDLGEEDNDANGEMEKGGSRDVANNEIMPSTHQEEEENHDDVIVINDVPMEVQLSAAPTSDEKENKSVTDSLLKWSLNDINKPLPKLPKVKRKRKLLPPPLPSQKTLLSEAYDTPVVRLPFEHGWTREIVHRALIHNVSGFKKPQKQIDVYYRAPHNRKFRSRREIAEFLEESSEKILSPINFSFSRRRLSSSPLEVERAAHGAAKRTAKTGHAPESPAGGAPMPKKKKKQSTKKDPKSTIKILQKDEQPDGTIFLGSTSIHPCQAFDASNGEENMTTARNCSYTCPGLEGILPSLHCSKCLCLFHPQCVGLPNDYDSQLQFVCQDCCSICKAVPTKDVMVTSTQQHMQSPVGHRAPPFNCMSTPCSFPYPLSQTIRFSPSPDVSIIPVLKDPLSLPSAHRSGQAKPVLQVPNVVTIEQIVTTKGTVGVLSQPVSVIPINSHPPQYPVPPLAPITQQKLPTVTSTATVVPVAIVSAANRTCVPLPFVKKAFMKHTPRRFHGRNIYSSQMARDVTPLQQNSHRTISRNLLENYTETKSDNHRDDHAYNKSLWVPNQFKDVLPIAIHSNTTVVRRPTNPGRCFVSNLSGGFKSLLKIFGYLSLPDILRASQVCKTWRDVANHPSMWERVTLKNIKIYDWNIFVKVIRVRRIHHLDMRGMIFSDDDKNMTHHGILAMLNELRDLQCLDLCEVPASIVHAVINQLANLRCFTAEWITENMKEDVRCKVDIRKFSRMSNLETLRIRGVYGLYLPSFAVSGGLNSIGSLHKLTCLSITSLRGVPAAELVFLNDLKNLKMVELGECLEWTEEVYESISNMKNLIKLRLEFGGANSARGIQIILASVHSLIHLELILFQIPSDFDTLLGKLTNLKQLTVWPDLKSNAEHNNYYLVKATKCLSTVKTMIWGLVTSMLTTPENRLESNRVDQNCCCIPYLLFSLGTYNPATVYISAHDLMSKLRSQIPHAKVQVIMVPNAKYSTIVYMPK